MVIFSAIKMLKAQVNLDSGLVAYYPFNGSANDESGNNNHGVVYGAILTMNRFGNDSSAYEFNGISSYISISNSPSLQSPSTELSQIAWIYIYSWSLVGTQFGPILMKSNSTANAFQYRLNVGPGHVNTSINNWNNHVIISDTLNFNEWYMIATTLKNDTVKTYIDGIFKGEDTLTGPINPNSLPLEIGRDVPGWTEVFHGIIDDIRIYNRALTELEIQELAGISTNIIDYKINASNYRLLQNYPNPFNPSTIIEFNLPKTSEVSLKVFSILGEEVVTLVSERLSAGSYSYEWDASNLASGVYLYKLKAGDSFETRKMMLMR
jgi:hypothetical protein